MTHDDSPGLRGVVDGLDRALHADFDGVLDEPIPPRLLVREPRWQGRARRLAMLCSGIAIGAVAQAWWGGAEQAPIRVLAQEAARAHVIYAAEVRHPVEVDAAQQAHLVQWLSKRLGRPVRVPVLDGTGYALLGGRLLPGADGPVAQFMYQDRGGQRLSLVVSVRHGAAAPTAFRFADEDGVAAFYWMDHDWAYVMTGQIDRQILAAAAAEVYRQLDGS